MAERDELKFWDGQIEAGKKFRKETADYDEWAKWKKYYRNDYEQGVIPVNLIFSIGRSVIPRIYFRNPQVTVQPQKPGMGLHARLVEQLDNWLVRKIGFKKTMKRAIHDTFITGTGLVKLGYDSEFGFDPEVDTVDPTEPVNYLPDDLSTRKEFNAQVYRGIPWALRVPGRDIVVPWGCESLDSADWIAHRYLRRLDDLKKDPKFSVPRDLSGTHTSKDFDGDRIQDIYHQQKDAEYVELWEIYDKREGRIKTIATGADRFLRNEPDELYGGEIPYESLVFNDDGDYFWGLSDCKIIEPQQLELNEIRTQYQSHRKLSLLKLIVDENAFSPEELEKLLSGDPGTIVKARENLQNAVHSFAPHIPPDLLQAAREVRDDIRESVGFSRNQMGEFDQSSRRTATEASIVQQAASIRVDERRDVVADLFANCVGRMNKFIFQNWTEEHVIQVIGPDGARNWVSYTGPQIEGDYDLRVDPESALPMTRELKKHDAHQLLQVIGGLGLPPDQVMAITKHLLNQYEGIDVESILSPGESPGQTPDHAIPLNEFMGGGGAERDAVVPVPMSDMPRPL